MAKLPSREEATGDEQDGQCDLEAVDVRIIHYRHITVADRLDQRANMPRPLSNFRPCKKAPPSTRSRWCSGSMPRRGT